MKQNKRMNMRERERDLNEIQADVVSRRVN